MLWKISALLFLFTQLVCAESGGPYTYEASHFAQTEARPLSFFAENIPIVGLLKKDGSLAPLQWKKREDGDPQISIGRVEDFPGQLCVVSYHPMEFLKLGVVRKSGILLLFPDGDGTHKVAFYQNAGSSGLVETYSLKTRKLLKDEPFLSITCHYSGNGGHKDRQYFRWKNFKLTPHALWATKPDFHQEIKKAGWELWHRGHWRTPSEMSSYSTVYRDPKNAKGGRSGHATIRINYEWIDEQLTAKDWQVLPENWKHQD